MAENVRSEQENEPTYKSLASCRSVVDLLQTRDIPRLEVMLAEQKAAGARKSDIAQTQKWLKFANRTAKRLQKSIQELERCQM